MRIMFISDLHATRPTDEQFRWLYNNAKMIKPDLILSAGDWDVGLTKKSLRPIIEKWPLLTIYGNHENMPELTRITHSLLNRPILINDFEVINYNDTLISGVNGIYSEKKNIKKGVPRQKGNSFIRKAQKFIQEYKPQPLQIDYFLCHETPQLPVYIKQQAEHLRFRMFKGSQLILQVINMVKPKIVLNGHLHFTGYTITELDYGGYYIRVDSSRKHRTFAVIDQENNEYSIKIYEEGWDNIIDHDSYTPPKI